MRLDKYLLEKGYCESRSKAQNYIKLGYVCINSKIITKASFEVNEEDIVQLHIDEVQFASRAGYKLYDAIDAFQIDLKDRICIDVGASTGGFSDVCLKQGAKKVYAIDVGKGQLIDRLRNDPRVVNIESFNCRNLTKDMFDDPITFACMDVSFISAKLILPALFKTLSSIEAFILIKPQFEAGKSALNKHGIVKDEKVHMHVLKDMVDFVRSYHLVVTHLQPSSIQGKDGNIEYVMHICENGDYIDFNYADIVKNHKKFLKR